jgi:hypothetical protein
VWVGPTAYAPVDQDARPGSCKGGGEARPGKCTLTSPTAKASTSYSRRDGDADFKFLARDAVPPYVDNRPMLVAGKAELREHKAILVGGDVEFSQFSEEITVNCAPLV